MRRTEFTSLDMLVGAYPISGWMGTAIYRLFRALLIGMPILLFSWSTAYGQCALVCNDDVNVSLPGPIFNCELEITIDMVMEDPSNCNGLDVTLMDLDGDPIPTSPIVNASHIGETFIYRVTDPSNGNSCWGTLDVEDKLPPTILDCENDSLYCLEDLTPELLGGDAPSPSIDDCSGFDYFYEDVVTEGDCDTYYAATIERTWTAFDDFGNTSTCTQILYIKKTPIDQFIPECPVNVVLSCDANGQPITHPDSTGYPQIEINGNFIDIVPGSDFYCEMASSYQDEEFDICGGGIKILRTWNVYDWCLPTVAGQNPWTCIQIIQVKDEIAPEIDCVPEIIEGSISTGCEAWVYVPPATVSDECSLVEVRIITPVGQINSNGGMTPLPLPVGDHPITYVATDECGNVTTCPSSIIVVDDTPPVTVCDEHTTISLTTDGTAQVSAVVFDDGSSDNCGIDKFEVSRMSSNCIPLGTPFDAFADFDCCDVGETIMIVLRVYDYEGNVNECMVDVDVQDKIDPTLACPPNKTVECSDPIPPVTPPTFNDNCTGADWDVEEENYIGSCGVGTVFRTFTVTDASGLTASCTQQITVINSNPFDESNITWPYDFTAFQCGFNLDPSNLPPANAEPVTSNDACDLIAVTFTDQPLPTNPPACYKILRNWIVIDWCQFDPNDPNTEGIWERTQILKVEDADNPVLDCPDDLTFESLDADCSGAFVTVPAIGIEDCSENFNYSYTVDYDSNGTNDDYGSTPNVSGTYPFGEHTITFTAEDLCGNSSTCTFKITVMDGKNPTPVCVNGITVELMADPGGDGGIIELTPEIFDNGSYDNCTNSDDLIISITPTTYRCVNLGTNIVTMWVTDAAGNADYCETYVIIQDNMGLCPQPNVAQVSGNVETENGMGVGEVMVEVSGNGPATAPVNTLDNGIFEFIDLETGHDYTFTPNRDDNPTNGVTTFDLVLITKHILNTTLLDSPYKTIAADANNSGSVTTMDVVELRRLILNIIPTFNNNTSWRFVDKNQTFADANNPFAEGIQEFYNVNDLDGDLDDVDFVAVKVGDVNNTVTPNNAISTDDRNSTNHLTFVVEDFVLEPGQIHSVSFKANDFTNILGYQFTLEFDNQALEFLEMNSGAIDVTNNNFGFELLDEGILTTSWNDTSEKQEGQAKNTTAWENQTLFTLTFRANTNKHLSDLLSIQSNITLAEAYRIHEGDDLHDPEIMGVELQFNHSEVQSDEFQLYQNSPNPFSEETTIGFNLPEASEATLTVYDVSGKTLKVVSGNFNEGYNQIRIKSNELRGSQVLYYRLESLTGTATMKMIIE